jgi:hypothetical protein
MDLCSNPHPARRLDATNKSFCSLVLLIGSNPHPARRLDATLDELQVNLYKVPILIQPEDWMQLLQLRIKSQDLGSNPHPARRLDATYVVQPKGMSYTGSNPHPARRLDATPIDPNPLIARSSKPIRAILLFPINPNRSKTQTKLPQTIAVTGIANLPGF